MTGIGQSVLPQGGTGSSEVVRTSVLGDTVVVVLIERDEVLVEGVADPQPWVLRTTQVRAPVAGQAPEVCGGANAGSWVTAPPTVPG